jgi:hypothetical protein
LLNHWQLTFERRIPEPAPVAPWRADLSAPSTVGSTFGGQPMTDPAGESLSSTTRPDVSGRRPLSSSSRPWSPQSVSTLSLLGQCILLPRRDPHSAPSGSERREAPSTASPIRAVIAGDVIVTGHEEESRR